MGALLVMGAVLFIIGGALGGLKVSLDMTGERPISRVRLAGRILCAAGIVCMLLPFGIERVRELLAN